MSEKDNSIDTIEKKGKRQVKDKERMRGIDECWCQMKGSIVHIARVATTCSSEHANFHLNVDISLNKNPFIKRQTIKSKRSLGLLPSISTRIPTMRPVIFHHQPKVICSTCMLISKYLIAQAWHKWYVLKTLFILLSQSCSHGQTWENIFSLKKEVEIISHSFTLFILSTYAAQTSLYVSIPCSLRKRTRYLREPCKQ